MKVLQKKILLLVISSILISALVVMVVAFTNFDRIVESNSEQIMQLLCSEKSQEIDEKLLNIEQSVHTIYHFATEQINETKSEWQNEDVFSEHINRMRELMEITAKYTDGAVSVYYRLSAGMPGIWLVQDESGNFTDYEITDISLYEKDDMEHVGWYYIPIANQKETWLNTYYNRNMNEEIISYVIPIILNEEVMGVVGMDIATDLLYDMTKTVTVYDTGYAFLMDNEGKFVYHPEMKGNTITETFNSQHVYLYEKSLVSAEKYGVEPYSWNGIDKILMSQKLRNGMIFTVCVNEREIEQPQRNMLIHSLLIILVVISVFVLGTVSIINVIVRMMYTDTMTKVGNKAAYTECIDSIYKKMADKDSVNFTVVVVDINNLKLINDTYGHEYGDILIQNGCAILKDVWGSNCIYRIGGDEFAIVYCDVDTKETQNKILLFEETMEKYNRENNDGKMALQMAIGAAFFDPNTDEQYMDVFRRADNEMYINKKQKKQKQIY